MDFIKAIIPDLVAVGLGIFFVFGYWRLQKNYTTTRGSDMRVVWYFFFLSLTLVILVFFAGMTKGWITKSGEPNGTMGNIIMLLLDFTINLLDDFLVYCALLIIVLVPQILAFIVCGVFFKCAKVPLLIGETIAFFSWSLVKSTVIAGAVFLGVAVCGYFAHWAKWNLLGSVQTGSIGIFLFGFSFVILFGYRKFETPRFTDKEYWFNKNIIKQKGD